MPPSRRTLLGTVAATLPLPLAGCQGARSNATGPSETATTEGEPATSTATAASETTTTEGETATSTATRSATSAASTSEASVEVETETDVVSLGEDGHASVRFDCSATGGSVAETSWDTIEQPDGSGTGILDYGDYAELELSDPGEYVLQLTATFESGALARDTLAFTVVEGTTSS